MQSGDGKQLDLQRQAVKFFVVVMESMCMRLIGTNSSLVALGGGGSYIWSLEEETAIVLPFGGATKLFSISIKFHPPTQ